MKVSKHYCNLCGKKMDMWDVQEGFGFNGNIGYGSKYDGEKLNLDLCCDCMDKLIESCVIPPIEDKDGNLDEHRRVYETAWSEL